MCSTSQAKGPGRPRRRRRPRLSIPTAVAVTGSSPRWRCRPTGPPPSSAATAAARGRTRPPCSRLRAEGPWTSSAPTATLSNPGQELFGISVALSADGTTALVGAWAASLDMGAAYVFHVTSEGSWATSSAPTATLANSAGSYEDDLGTSVALSADGTTALIGAPGAGDKGAAYVFNVPSEGSWALWSSTPTATLADTDGSDHDEFGTSVALSADGTTALIGAPGVSSGTGAAYVFNVASEGSWASSSTPTATLTVPAGAADDYFGTSVALSADGTTALIGAYGASSGTGAAYVFNAASEGPWATSSAPTATLANSAGSRRRLIRLLGGDVVRRDHRPHRRPRGQLGHGRGLRVPRLGRRAMGHFVDADGHPFQLRRLRR